MNWPEKAGQGQQRSIQAAKSAEERIPAMPQANLVRLLTILMHGHWPFAFLVLGVLLVASVAEGVGFSLLIPLMEVVTNSPPRPEFGVLGEFLRGLVTLFPPDFRLAGVLGLLTIVFLVKSVTLVLSTGLIRYFVNTLRLAWVGSAFTAYTGASYARVAALPQGAVLQNILGETDMAARGVFVLIESLARIIQICILIILLLLVNWKVTLVVGVVALIFVALAWRSSGRFSVGSGYLRRSMRQQVAEVVAESILALRTLKMLGLGLERRKVLEKRLAEFRSADTRFEVLSALPGNLTDFVAVAAGVVTILFLTMWAGIPLEVVLSMVVLFGLVFLRLSNAISFLFSKRMQILSLVPSLEVVSATVTIDAEQEPGGAPFPGFTGDIRFEHIDLCPPNRDVVFHDLNLRIPARGMTAIVGPSGSGKTTLVDLLVRLREPDRGRISIDGEDIRQFDVRSIRACVGYLNQDPQLFNGSIRENLLMGCLGAGDDELRSAARRVHAHDFIMAMPDGYETQIGHGGVTLSGGQRQRLALARELVRAPNLYIFDEPTSALDHEAEAAIGELIGELSQTHPVIVITHRRGAISGAKVIYRLENGKAVPTAFDDQPFLH